MKKKAILPLQPNFISENLTKSILNNTVLDPWSFLCDFRLENQELAESTIKQLTTTIQEDANRIILELENKNNLILTEMKELQLKYNNLKDSLNLIENFALEEQNKQKIILEKRLKKLNRIKTPLRDTISPIEFERALVLIKGKPLAQARKRVAYYLLFLTGIRVTNLLVLNVRHINEIMNFGSTTISEIKNGEQRKLLTFPRSYRELLKRVSSDLLLLTSGKEEGDILFHSQKDFKKPMNKTNFTQDLNIALKLLSKETGSYIRTHSFRATVITSLLENQVPIHEVMSVIGHKSIESTLLYNRCLLTKKQIKDRLSRRKIKTRRN